MPRLLKAMARLSFRSLPDSITLVQPAICVSSGALSRFTHHAWACAWFAGVCCAAAGPAKVAIAASVAAPAIRLIVTDIEFSVSRFFNRLALLRWRITMTGACLAGAGGRGSDVVSEP